MTHKTKKKVQNSGTSFLPLTGIVPTFTASTSGGVSSPKYLREDGKWVSMSDKANKVFNFKVRGKDILQVIFHREYVKRVEHLGFWPFKFTRIYLVDDIGQDRATIGNINYWFTSETEHAEIKEQIYDWLYREKIIDAL